MRMIVLDGYNVMMRSPAFRPDERRDLAAARDKLENLLSWAVGNLADVRFLLVFDGADLPGNAARPRDPTRPAAEPGWAGGSSRSPRTSGNTCS